MTRDKKRFMKKNEKQDKPIYKTICDRSTDEEVYETLFETTVMARSRLIVYCLCNEVQFNDNDECDYYDENEVKIRENVLWSVYKNGVVLALHITHIKYKFCETVFYG